MSTFGDAKIIKSPSRPWDLRIGKKSLVDSRDSKKAGYGNTIKLDDSIL